MVKRMEIYVEIIKEMIPNRLNLKFSFIASLLLFLSVSNAKAQEDDLDLLVMHPKL